MQYDILRDVLIIVVSVIAVLGAIIGGIVFFLLRESLTKDIKADVKKDVDRECRKLRGQSWTQAGVTYWMQHRYDKAIKVTKQAITEAGDVLDESELVFAKSNLGYYYGEKHKQQPQPDLKEEATDLTKIGFERYSPSINAFQEPDWIDNFVFVKAVFAQTNEERKEVLQLIDSLSLRGDLVRIYADLKETKQYLLTLT